MMSMCRERDESGLICGYPLPCPWHTVVVDTTSNPPEISDAPSKPLGRRMRARLQEIGQTVGQTGAHKARGGERGVQPGRETSDE